MKNVKNDKIEKIWVDYKIGGNREEKLIEKIQKFAEIIGIKSIEEYRKLQKKQDFKNSN